MIRLIIIIILVGFRFRCFVISVFSSSSSVWQVQTTWMDHENRQESQAKLPEPRLLVVLENTSLSSFEVMCTIIISLESNHDWPNTGSTLSHCGNISDVLACLLSMILFTQEMTISSHKESWALILWGCIIQPHATKHIQKSIMKTTHGTGTESNSQKIFLNDTALADKFLIKENNSNQYHCNKRTTMKLYRSIRVSRYWLSRRSIRPRTTR